MTDFSNLNPDNNLRTGGLTPGRQSGPPKPDGNVEQPAAPPGDPYADLKMDPDRMMALLSAQSRANIQRIEHPGIEKSMDAFKNEISPERHAEVTQKISRLFANEFQSPPNPEMLQQLVDDFLIGQPSIHRNA